MIHARLIRFTIAIAVLAAVLPLRAAEAALTETNTAPSEAALTAMKRFHAAGGLSVDLYAAEPQIQNVVNFAFDEKGRCYVVETHRRRTSVIDIRTHTNWLNDDFSFRTVENRADFFRRTFPVAAEKISAAGIASPSNGLADFNKDGVVDWRDFEVESERIRLLTDTDGDGRADAASTLAEGFDGITSGVAAGVLARKGDVYFTCIPDLWKISSDKLRAGARLPEITAPANPHRPNPEFAVQRLFTGFGVHISMGGHDMHGLRLGPDGKLYWSIADRATSTNILSLLTRPFPGLTPELVADSGCVFRCNPDGSEFEIVACGLRNPQELAFDDFGNLFTGDNNGDGGDKARWHYIVEGGDYGWRLGWQWLPKMGAWNSERLWHLSNSNTAAYLLPALAHIGHGPAGLCYNPGTGLPPVWDHYFFMCDFPGSVLAWTNISRGASFSIGPVQNFFGETEPTDVDFGVDGGVYVSDWVKGWDKTGQGRIWRIHDPATDSSRGVQETKRLLADGLDKWGTSEVAALLAHPDARVRAEAQSWFVEHGYIQQLLEVAEGRGGLRARVHALWGIGQIESRRQASLRGAGEYPDSRRRLARLMTDPEPEIRVQAAKILGSLKPSQNDKSLLLSLLHDNNDRVRFFAAETLGKSGDVSVAPALIELLRENADRDLYLRHAAVYALARLGNVAVLSAARADSSRAVRMAALLALRRLGSSEVSRWLNDEDPQVALEAARAIYDAPIPKSLPDLASLAVVFDNDGKEPDAKLGFSGKRGARLQPKPKTPTPAEEELRSFALRRALNANYRIGTPEAAGTLAGFAASDTQPVLLRAEALELLGLWPRPEVRDRVVGLWRPLPDREAKNAANALRSIQDRLLTNSESAIRLGVLKAALALEAPIDLFALSTNADDVADVRAEALKSLAAAKDPRASEAIALAAASADAGLRFEAARIQNLLDPGRGMASIRAALGSGTTLEKQDALALLGASSSQDADGLMSEWLDRLIAGNVPPELRLDVLDAVGKRGGRVLKEKLTQYEGTRSKEDLLAKWRECLTGGNAEKGRQSFVERQDLACFRCHKIHGEGGEVGPDLAGIGGRQTREYILESILYPNRAIAAGFENVSLTLADDSNVAGMVKSETAADISVQTAEDGLVTVKKDKIKSRDRGLSPMPEDLGSLISKRDLRDLVEFLAATK